MHLNKHEFLQYIYEYLLVSSVCLSYELTQIVLLTFISVLLMHDLGGHSHEINLLSCSMKQFTTGKMYQYLKKTIHAKISTYKIMENFLKYYLVLELRIIFNIM